MHFYAAYNNNVVYLACAFMHEQMRTCHNISKMVSNIIKGNQNTTKLIAELKKAAKQYPPLSKEEERKLIEANLHDREKLNNLLFMHNVRIVFRIAKKYMSRTDDFDSMVQDGMLGLAIAASTFDVNRGVKFITHAMSWIMKKVLERFYVKEYKITKRSTSLNAPTASSKTNDNDDPDLENYVNEYIDMSVYPIKSLRNQISSNEQVQLCADLYTELDNRSDVSDIEKNIFIDLFYNREKARDLQLKYGVSSKDIANAKSKILKIMKNQLAVKYDIHSFSDVYDA